MTEFLRLICCQHPSRLMHLLHVSGIPKYEAYPQLIDENTTGWWHCSTLGTDQPSTICVWVTGKRVTFQFESGVLKSILAPTKGEVLV